MDINEHDKRVRETKKRIREIKRRIKKIREARRKWEKDMVELIKKSEVKNKDKAIKMFLEYFK